MESLGTLSPLVSRLDTRGLFSSECPQHEGVNRLDCKPCRAAAAEAEAAEAELEAITAAGVRCDERFPSRYRSASVELAEIAAWVARFQADPAGAPNLLLLGITGSGKTWSAYGALRAAATSARPNRAGVYRTPRWCATTFADFVAALRPSKVGDSAAVMKQYLEADLLLLDDLALGKASEFTEESTYRLLNGRYNEERPCIFTSNLAVEQLRDSLGDRIASRLAETCMRVVLRGPDRRRTQAS